MTTKEQLDELKAKCVDVVPQDIIGWLDYKPWPEEVQREVKEALHSIGDTDDLGNPLGCISHLECIIKAERAITLIEAHETKPT